MKGLEKKENKEAETGLWELCLQDFYLNLKMDKTKAQKRFKGQWVVNTYAQKHSGFILGASFDDFP